MSLLGTLLRPKSFPPKPTAIAAATCSRTGRPRGDTERRECQGRLADSDGKISGGRRRQARQRPETSSVEDVFIQSLVIASTCRGCSVAPPSTTSPLVKRTGTNLEQWWTSRHCSRATSRRSFSTSWPRSQAGTAAQAVGEPEVTREQYEDLANTYGAPQQPRNNADIEEKKSQHYRLAPRLALTPEQEDHPQPRRPAPLPAVDPEHEVNRRRLVQKLRRLPHGEASEKIWRLYSALPTPRVRYLTDSAVKRLLRHLSWVEKRDMSSSMRYFSVLEEALADSVALDPWHWNTAISYAGRWTRRTSQDDVKSAIETWLRMEREGGVSANNVTFNILFDLAVKAGRFALADTIHAELQRRGLPLNRYFRTSKIYYAGMRGDGENVRAAFRELVAAGEIIDTSVMNCVLLSLVRCDEIASAEHILRKMIRLHEQKFGVAALVDWREKKAKGRELDQFARELREQRQKHLESFFGSPYVDDDKKEEMQRKAPIAPDELSYRILIQWHADKSGNLEQIRSYIDAIEEAGHKIHHNIFFQLFKAFYKHGGYSYTAWNRKSLEEYWSQYLSTIASDAAAAEVTAEVKAALKKPPVSAESFSIYPLDPSDAEFTHHQASAEADVAKAADDDDDEDIEPTPSHLAPIEFRQGPVAAALAAFYKCAGLPRMLEVWDEVQVAWKDMSEAERSKLEGVVTEKRQDAGVYLQQSASKFVYQPM